MELLGTLGERMSCSKPLFLCGDSQPGHVDICPTTLVHSRHNFQKRVPESGHGGKLRWAVRVEVNLMGSLGLGEGLVVMAEASGVRTSDQG